MSESIEELKCLKIVTRCLKELSTSSQKHRLSLLYQLSKQMERFCTLLADQVTNRYASRELFKLAEEFEEIAKIFKVLNKVKKSE